MARKSMPKFVPNTNRRSRRQQRGVQTYIHRNQRVRIPDGHLAVGLITTAHGLRGEVKVELHTDFPERFVEDAELYLGDALEKVTIMGARPHQGQMLLQFHEITSREGAEALRGLWIFVPEAEAVALDEDTYFVHDIIGLAVETVTGEPIGTVTDVLFTGANEVYIVAPPDDPKREILLPAIADVVKEINLELGTMVVELLPGLLDE